MAREVTQDFMDIDDEITLQDITFQVVEFRKEQIFDTFYEKSSNTLIYEHAKINNFLIIIPWIVLEELDGLKNAPGSLVSHSIATTSSQSPYDNQANVKTLAKTAITFLHNCLSQKLDGLRGQKIYEKLENAKNNDDKILDCCSKSDGLKGILEMIISKSSLNPYSYPYLELNGIQKNPNNSWEDYHPTDNIINNNNDGLFSPPIQYPQLPIVNNQPEDYDVTMMDCDDSVPLQLATNNIISLSIDESMIIQDDDLILKAAKINGLHPISSVQTIAFCSYLPTAMIYYFEKFLGHDWTYFVKDPEPWSILTIFKLLDRYWFTVFSEVFQDSRTIQEVTIVNARSFIDQWQNSSNKNYSNLSYNYNMIDDNNNNSLTIRELVQFIQNSETIIKLIYSDLKGTNLSISQLNAITEKWWQEFQASLY
ncbi:5157_t:CDS:2 [Entrophospora sp. SA101]|nr:5157_t:CDS:2 [Entrophospora sp. SA101]